MSWTNLPEIPVCVGYKIDGKETERFQRKLLGSRRSSPSTPSCRAGSRDVWRRQITMRYRRKRRVTWSLSRRNRAQGRHRFHRALIANKRCLSKPSPKRLTSVHSVSAAHNRGGDHGGAGSHLDGQSREEDEVASIFSELEAASRQEPGCLMYVVHRHRTDPRLASSFMSNTATTRHWKLIANQRTFSNTQ